MQFTLIFRMVYLFFLFLTRTEYQPFDDALNFLGFVMFLAFFQYLFADFVTFPARHFISLILLPLFNLTATLTFRLVGVTIDGVKLKPVPFAFLAAFTGIVIANIPATAVTPNKITCFFMFPSSIFTYLPHLGQLLLLGFYLLQLEFIFFSNQNSLQTILPLIRYHNLALYLVLHLYKFLLFQAHQIQLLYFLSPLYHESAKTYFHFETAYKNSDTLQYAP